MRHSDEGNNFDTAKSCRGCGQPADATLCPSCEEAALELTREQVSESCPRPHYQGSLIGACCGFTLGTAASLGLLLLLRVELSLSELLIAASVMGSIVGGIFGSAKVREYADYAEWYSKSSGNYGDPIAVRRGGGRRQYQESLS